jgi:hypothetical protein
MSGMQVLNLLVAISNHVRGAKSGRGHKIEIKSPNFRRVFLRLTHFGHTVIDC